jgi:hypothetical protein
MARRAPPSDLAFFPQTLLDLTARVTRYAAAAAAASAVKNWSSFAERDERVPNHLRPVELARVLAARLAVGARLETTELVAWVDPTRVRSPALLGEHDGVALQEIIRDAVGRETPFHFEGVLVGTLDRLLARVKLFAS